jgi:hypothetical protein
MSKRPFVGMGLLDCLAGTLLAPGVLPAFRARVNPVEGFQRRRARDYPAGTGHVLPWGQMQCGSLATWGHPLIALAARQQDQSRQIDDRGAIRMGCARISRRKQAAVRIVFVGGPAVADSYLIR